MACLAYRTTWSDQNGESEEVRLLRVQRCVRVLGVHDVWGFRSYFRLTGRAFKEDPRKNRGRSQEEQSTYAA